MTTMPAVKTWMAGALVALAACRSSGVDPPPPPPTVTIAPPPVSTAPPPPAPSASPKRAECPDAHPIGIASMSPDGRFLATACSGRDPPCSDGLVDLWDTASGELARHVDVGDANIVAFEWSAKGMLAAAGDPTTGMCMVRVFDPANGKLAAGSELYCFTSFAFDPPGDRLVAGGCDGQMKLYDIPHHRIVTRPLKEAHIGGDHDNLVRFVDGGRKVLIVDQYEGIETLDPATLRRLSSSGAPALGLGVFRISPGDERVVGIEEDGSIYAAERRGGWTWKKVTQYAGGWVTAMDWLDASRVAVGWPDGHVAVIDATKPGSPPIELRASGPEVVDVKAAAGQVAVLDTKAITVWDAASRAIRTTLPVPQTDAGVVPSRAIAWSPKGDVLAAFIEGEIVLLRSDGSVTRVPMPASHPLLARRLELTADGRFAFATDGRLHVVRLADGAAVTVASYDVAGQRTAVVTSDTAFAGPAEIGMCDGHDRTARPTLLADFLAGR